MSKCSCTAMGLAHYIVNKCTIDGYPVSNLQLQKIMYFLQSIFCMVNGRLLFEERFEAWPYGPVLPSVYREYSAYGGRRIAMKYEVLEDYKEDLKSYLDGGIEVLRTKSPWDLVKTSHAPNSPWAETYREGVGYKETIPNELILGSSKQAEA